MKAETQCVRNNLGLVCITTSDEVRYKTVTRKALLQLDAGAQKEKLRAIYAANIEILQRAIRFCATRDIRLYRMTSGLFPFSDEATGAEILEVCRRARVPMVFDAHHHICRENLEDYNHPSVSEAFWSARETWKNPANQMVHISNGRTKFTDRAHSDLIFTMPEVFRFAPWIEVEAKHKEIAIAKLQTEWLR
jgi:UV DNA damage repair endonuclease